MATYVKTPYNNLGKWVCDNCIQYPYETIEPVLVHDSDKHSPLCEHCYEPLVSIRTLKEIGVTTRPQMNHEFRKDIQDRLYYLDLIKDMSIGVPCKMTWKRKWVVVIPLVFEIHKYEPFIRLAFVAGSSKRKWGETYFKYTKRNVPSKIEAIEYEDLPTFIGANETPWLGKLMKGDLNVEDSIQCTT